MFTRKPRIERLRRRRDVEGLIQALEYRNFVSDRGGRTLDLGSAVRLQAVAALADVLAEIGGGAAIDALGRALRDPEERVRMAAVEALWNHGDRRAVDPLIEAVAEVTAEGRWRTSALDAIVELSDERTASRLVEEIVARDRPIGPEELRAFELLTALDFGPDSASPVVSALVAALADDNPVVRQNAEGALRSLPSGDFDSLVRGLERPRTRAAAARLLGHLRDNRAVPQLVSALKDPEADVRASAASALGQIKDPRAVEDLVRATTDSDPGVRDAAGAALDELGTIATVLGVAALTRQGTGDGGTRSRERAETDQNGSIADEEAAPEVDPFTRWVSGPGNSAA
jgi:HEAT repeat protein